MIKADEARELYQEVQLKGDTFIKDTIEPMIRQSAQTERFITLKFTEGWYQGWWFDGMTDSKKIDIFKYVIEELKSAGYKVTTEVNEPGNEYRNGYGYVTIDWS